MNNEQPIKKCKNFKEYKGIKRPKCNCIACREKYINELELQIKQLKQTINDVI